MLISSPYIQKTEVICNYPEYSSNAYSEPCQTSKMVFMTKLGDVIQSLTIFARRSNLDVSQVSEKASATFANYFNRIKLFTCSHSREHVAAYLQMKGAYLCTKPCSLLVLFSCRRSHVSLPNFLRVPLGRLCAS